jgi:transposase
VVDCKVLLLLAMAPRLPEATLERLRYLLFETDAPIGSIHERLGIGRTTVYEIRLSYELFGTPYLPAAVRRGRPPILSNEEVFKLLLYLEDRPTEYLDELAWYCYDEFDKVIAPQTIWDVLKRQRWSRKRCKERAAEQSAELRADWELQRADWRGDRLCFVDESACKERTADRKYGWAPLGLPSRIAHSLRRGVRWSVLPALTTEGWLPDPLIYQGSVDGQMFIDWLEEDVLPKLGVGWILIMDNASIHHMEGARELVESFGVELKYLPPYSPDLNPIELTSQQLALTSTLDASLSPHRTAAVSSLQSPTAQTRSPHQRRSL